MFDKTGKFKSSNGINDVYYYIWYPKDIQEAKGVLQLIHGMAEHSGRYNHFARFMAEHGFIVCQNDNLGHGKTANNQFGYISDEKGDIYLVKDTYRLTKIMKTRYPNKKYYLFGHSMGSFIARDYCIKYGDALNGVVFSGTNGGGVLYYFLKEYTKILCKVKGPYESGDFLDKVNGILYNARFKPIETGKEWLSRDVDVQKEFNKDEMCGHIFTMAGYKDLMELIGKVNNAKWFKNYPKKLSTFFISGSEDPVGDYGKGVIKAYKGLIKQGNFNVFIKLYKDGRHEMLNEINKLEVYHDLLKWFTDIND